MFITQDPIRLERFFSFSPQPSCGALASFVGIVRNHDHGRAVKKLFYECYFSMAEKMIGQVIEEAKREYGVDEILVRHRVGSLEIGEAAVAIMVSAVHRAEAFAACRFVIEQIKTKVPIWKKQIFEEGDGEWVSCGERPGSGRRKKRALWVGQSFGGSRRKNVS